MIRPSLVSVNVHVTISWQESVMFVGSEPSEQLTLASQPGGRLWVTE